MSPLTASEEMAQVLKGLKWKHDQRLRRRQRATRQPAPRYLKPLPEDRGKPYEVIVEDYRLYEIEMVSRRIRHALNRKHGLAEWIAINQMDMGVTNERTS